MAARGSGPAKWTPRIRRTDDASDVRLLEDLGDRIRDVRQGPDGMLYLLTDSEEGRIVRPKPGKARS